MEDNIKEECLKQKVLVDELVNTKKSFVEDQLSRYPDADPQVLYFISDILHHSGIENCEVIRNLFHNGYCLYFAEMLKSAFTRGEICWAAPFGHFVWKDNNGICYDIEGVTISEADYFIPIAYLGDAINDFRHIRGVEFNATQEDISRFINSYLRDME